MLPSSKRAASVAALFLAASAALAPRSSAQVTFSQWGIGGSNFSAAATLADLNSLQILHGAGDGVSPTKSIEYYYATNKTVGSPIDACKSRGGTLGNNNDTTALNLVPTTTVCNGTADSDSECTTTIQFGFDAGIGDSAFYEPGDGTAVIQLCIRFTLQDVIIPRSEWCSSSDDEQPGKTLDGSYFGPFNGGRRRGDECEDLCRADPRCNSWMRTTLANSCYLSQAHDLIDGGFGQRQPFTFNVENCDPVPSGEALDIRSGEFAFEWTIDLEGDIVSSEIFDAVDGGAESIAASGVVEVEAFPCDATGAEISPSPLYAEGEVVFSCVRTTDGRFRIADIDAFTYQSPSGAIVQNAVIPTVTGGVEAGLSVKDCTLVSGECQVATLLVDGFFSEDAGTILASGVAVAEASTTRHLSQTGEGSKRRLTASMETFDMEIQLSPATSSALGYIARRMAWMGALIVVVALI